MYNLIINNRPCFKRGVLGIRWEWGCTDSLSLSLLSDIQWHNNLTLLWRRVKPTCHEVVCFILISGVLRSWSHGPRSLGLICNEGQLSKHEKPWLSVIIKLFSQEVIFQYWSGLLSGHLYVNQTSPDVVRMWRQRTYSTLPVATLRPLTTSPWKPQMKTHPWSHYISTSWVVTLQFHGYPVSGGGMDRVFCSDGKHHDSLKKKTMDKTLENTLT